MLHLNNGQNFTQKTQNKNKPPTMKAPQVKKLIHTTSE